MPRRGPPGISGLDSAGVRSYSSRDTLADRTGREWLSAAARQKENTYEKKP